MSAAKPCNQQLIIKKLLTWNKDQGNDAFQLLNTNCKEYHLHVLEEHFPSLDRGERENVWQQVMTELLTKAKEGQFRENGSLCWLLRGMCNNRATDLLRKRTKVELVSHEKLCEVETRSSASPADCVLFDEFKARVWAIVNRMPRQQKLVWAMYLKCFPRLDGIQDLWKALVASGERITLQAVKRAWQEGRKKLRDLLDEE